MEIKDSKFQKLKRWPSIVGNVSWFVIVLTFIFCLGGFHPSNSFRDDILIFASVLVVVLNVPVIIQIVNRITSKKNDKATKKMIFYLILRLGIIAYFIYFIHGISHEWNNLRWIKLRINNLLQKIKTIKAGSSKSVISQCKKTATLQS